MSAITQARQSLADDLSDALDVGTDTLGAIVLDHVPEELPAPCLVIDAGEDYLTLGDTFGGGDWWLTLRVYALVDLVNNDQATEDLEALLAAILPPLTRSGWEVGPITKPGPFNTTLWLAHGVAITLRALITL